MTSITNVELPSQKQFYVVPGGMLPLCIYKKIRNHIVPENRNKNTQ